MKLYIKSTNPISLIAICFTHVLFLFLATSCKKNLDKKPNSSLIIPSSLQDLQGLMDDAINMNIALTPSYGEFSSGDCFLLPAMLSPRPFFEQQAYKWIPADYQFINDWSTCYRPIYSSNLCLDLLNDIKPANARDEAAWKNVKGSALFYRSYYFLMLAWNYAKAYDPATSSSDLGIVLRLGSDFNEKSTRASVKETYDQIIKDGKDCIDLLPVNSLHPYRPSKLAAYGLLARAFLSMRQYDEAFKYANMYLQLKSDLINLNEPNKNGFTTTGATLPFLQFNVETIFYTEMNFAISALNTARSLVDSNLYKSYSTTDNRRAAYFRTSQGPYQRFKGSYANSGASFFSGIATDEIFLIRAECYARAGNKDAGLADLNTLLVKKFKPGFIPFTATTAEQALDIILTERRKELLYRGLRWIDIKRLNKEGRNITLTRTVNGQTFTIQPNANYYALPLPTDIITLTKMPQNPI